MQATEQINFSTINPKCSCFNLRKATRAVTQFYDHALEPAGIRATQFTLLVTLASVEAKTLTEMASTLVMDRTTLTRNLKPLEKMGLIQTVEPRDKRSKAYALTDKGKEVLNKGVPLWKGAQTKLLSHFGDERYEKFLNELGGITKTISSL